MATPEVGKTAVSDSDSEDLFASPSKPSKKAATQAAKQSESQRGGESKYDAEQAREAALQSELDGLRNVNEVVENVISSIERAKGNMDTISQTVTSASTLLNTWIRILSQTEHNQRLILNPDWKGASQDVAEMENEVVLKAQAAERRAAEDDRRKEEARRRAEDEERQRQAGTAARGTRGRARGRGLGRGVSGGSVRGHASVGETGGRGSVPGPGLHRRGSQIGRGTGIARGRGRGSR